MSSILPHAVRTDVVAPAASTAASNRAPSLHSMLREATRAHHEILDEALSRFDLADAPSYRRFLLVHHQALAALLEHCSDDDRRELSPLLSLLEDDLGMEPAPRTSIPDLPASNRATQLGVAYVLRGSRLGARFLCRRVGATFPARYLRHEVDTPWAAFLERLEAVPPATRTTNAIIDAARMAFGVFVRAADDPTAGLPGRSLFRESPS